MAAWLPLVCLWLGYAALGRSRSGGDEEARPRRERLLTACVGWGVWTIVLTEALGAARLLTYGWLAAAWSVCALSLGIACVRLAPRPKAALLTAAGRSPGPVGLALAAASILLATGFVAWSAPPTNVDSMVYHLPRVDRWAAQASVEHFATHVRRQLWQPPAAEYFLLHLRILSGADRLYQLLQWLAALGCALGVSLIAARLGGSPRTQAFAALVCVTLPSGVLQSTTTQNDWVVSFWLVCLVERVLAIRAGGARPADPWLVGAGLGLACLTKGTAYVYAVPLVSWSLASVWTRRGPAAAARLWLPALAVAGILNFGHWARNAETFGYPLGAPLRGADGLTNRQFSPAALLSNAARNASLHAGTPWPAVNIRLEEGLRRFHGWIGVSPDDRSTTYYTYRFRVRAPSKDEDADGNPLHLALGIWAVLWCAHPRRRRCPDGAGSFAVVLAAGWILFCWLFKWQPWHARLHLPLFVLAAGWSAAILGSAAGRRTVAVTAIILWAAALGPAACRPDRPVFGSGSVLTADRSTAYRRFRHVSSAAEFLASRGCDRVGLWVEEGFLEYPFRLILEKKLERPVIMEHVLTGSRSEDRAFVPSAIVVAGRTVQGERVRRGGVEYGHAFTSGPIQVFLADRPERGEASVVSH